MISSSMDIFLCQAFVTNMSRRMFHNEYIERIRTEGVKEGNEAEWNVEQIKNMLPGDEVAEQ